MDIQKNLFALMAALAMAGAVSCNSSKEKSNADASPKKDTPEIVFPAKQAGKRPPIINITDTLSDKRTIIYMKDSARTLSRIGLKLGEIYSFKLAAVVKKNGLKITGRPMAWFNSGRKEPCFFEAGIAVNKKPARQPSNILLRQTGTDSVLVAHFYGPYELLPDAYEALNDILKSRKKKLGSKPYEIYVGDPLDKDGNIKDPYKVQTDVVYPIR